MASTIYMFITSRASKKQFSSRKLLTQAHIQSYFRVVHMKTYTYEINFMHLHLTEEEYL